MTSLASTLGAGAIAEFTFAFAMLQIPIGVIGVPLGHRAPAVARPARRRPARRRRSPACWAAALAILAYVMIGIAAHRHRRRREDLVRLLFGVRRHRRGRDRGDRRRPGGVPARADRPLADRRARPGVLRAPGHEDAGRGRARSRWSSNIVDREPAGRPVRARRPRGGDRDRRLARDDGARRPAPRAGRLASGSVCGIGVVMVKTLPSRGRRRGRVRAWRRRSSSAGARTPGYLAAGRPLRSPRSRPAGSSIVAGVARVADRGAAHDRRGDGRPGPPAGTRVTAARRPASATAAGAGSRGLGRRGRGEPAGLVPPARRPGRGSRRSTAGRSPHARRRTAGAGAQVLLRRPGPLPWAFAYAPRGPVLARWDAAAIERVHRARPRRPRGRRPRVSHLRIDPEIERGGAATRTAASPARLRPPAGGRPRRSSPSPRGRST